MESLWRVRLVGQDTALSRPVHGFESRTRCQELQHSGHEWLTNGLRMDSLER